MDKVYIKIKKGENMRFLSIILSLFLFAQTVSASPLSGNAKTKRIPAGTKFALQLTNSVSTTNSEGSEFTAIMMNDQTADQDVILPMGSIIRGNIKEITPAKRMSKGAILYLDFDHVVTPNGRQVPLSLSLIGRADMTNDGGITTTKGYADAWKQTCKKSGQITTKSIEWGKGVTDTGWQYVIVPVTAFGGAFGTAGYFVYDSIADLIRTGKQVQINSNEVLNVILVEPIDVPVI